MDRSWLRIAHRGASAAAPELKRAAILRAPDIGGDMIEVDVQLTGDGHPVVMHDETLERTTNGTGLVRERTWEEIRDLDAGSWFAPAFAGERPLDLDGLLDLVGDRARLNVEIKAGLADADVLIPLLLDRLAAAGQAERAIISCFDLEMLARVRAASSTAALGVLWFMPEVDDALAAVDRLGAVALHPYVRTASDEMFSEARRRGIATHVWTVNDVPTMQRLVEVGASGIMTDHPEVFASVDARAAGA